MGGFYGSPEFSASVLQDRVELGFHFSSVLVPLLLQKSGAGARNVYVYLNGMSVFMSHDFSRSILK